MASIVDPNGHVNAPLNITAPAPILNLRGFQWATVDAKIQGPQDQPDGQAGHEPLQHRLATTAEPPLVALPPSAVDQLGLEKPPPPLDFPLTQFQGSYAGNGFNTIFRPRANDDKSVPEPHEGPPDNILELNLTTEQLTFGDTIGAIPNRGLEDQPDIILGGLPYLQKVQDVTNPSTGKGDSLDKVDIHFEPGMWLTVPAAQFHKKPIASVTRMASIPHGTTINAQGLIPTHVSTTTLGGNAGPPVIDDIDTTPFDMADPSQRLTGIFPSMDADNQHTFRIPQNLEKFNEKGTGLITTAIIKNPNLVLKNAIKGQEILETISFTVSTGPPSAELNGGGTGNISFLCGHQDPITTNAPTKDDNPIAHAAFMTSKYWIERVAYKVVVPRLTTKTTLLLKPTMPVGSTAPTPVFAITTPEGGVPAMKEITVPGIQIQSSQIVNLNFKTLSWPHASVSTLVPKGPQPFQMT